MAGIPEETAGPFPGDGSNGVNVLTASGIVRSDITCSFGTSTKQAAGIPLTLRLRVLHTRSGSVPYIGAAVYVWHCDAQGRYSLYSAGVTQENYLRGVQAAGSDGNVAFTSVFPAAYPGRWPHVHFEVYPTLVDAVRVRGKLRTTQLALPESVCKKVYSTTGYDGSLANLARTSLKTDMVFSDGYSLQMATLTGDPRTGLTATLDAPV